MAIRKWVVIAGVALLAGMFNVQAQFTPQVLLNFTNSGTNPYHPNCRLVDGTNYFSDFLYGTAAYGGTYNKGALIIISKITGGLSSFAFADTNGSEPCGGLIWGNDGASLYGLAKKGGAYNQGTAFVLTSSGLSALFSFGGSTPSTNGASPVGPLTWGSDGNLYGVTTLGGAFNVGTVFKLSPLGQLTQLIVFNGTNGDTPVGGLVAGPDGAFYGVTTFGGTNVYPLISGTGGTIYKITTNGIMTTLAQFDGTNGWTPYGALCLASDGNFYGTTANGGIYRQGTIFKMTPDGRLTTIVHFNGTNGAGPFATLCQGNDLSLYGTTGYSRTNGVQTNGTLFRLTLDSQLTTLTYFIGTNSNIAISEMIQSRNGYLYGAMADSVLDIKYNGGNIYRLLLPPRLTSIIPTGNSFKLTWTTCVSNYYIVEQKTSMADTNWNWTFRYYLGPARTNQMEWTDFSPTNGETYYRIGLLTL